jgi:hypothetical protein
MRRLGFKNLKRARNERASLIGGENGNNININMKYEH